MPCDVSKGFHNVWLFVFRKKIFAPWRKDMATKWKPLLFFLTGLNCVLTSHYCWQYSCFVYFVFWPKVVLHFPEHSMYRRAHSNEGFTCQFWLSCYWVLLEIFIIFPKNFCIFYCGSIVSCLLKWLSYSALVFFKIFFIASHLLFFSVSVSCISASSCSSKT